jgi:hypothetical protein
VKKPNRNSPPRSSSTEWRGWRVDQKIDTFGDGTLGIIVVLFHNR